MLVGSAVKRVAILGGLRLPFARAYGAYAGVGNQEMLTETFRALVDRYRLDGERLGDVIAGAAAARAMRRGALREYACRAYTRRRRVRPRKRTCAAISRSNDW